MLTPADIHAFASRRYREVLAAAVTGDQLFPLPIPLGAWPSEDLQALKTAGAALRAIAKEATGHGPTITWTERNTRRFGLQPIPERLEFSTLPDYLRFHGKEKEHARFIEHVTATRTQVPALVPWIVQYPQRLVDKFPVWDDVLLVCRHFLEHPLPNCYPREIRLPIGTKLIESERALLRQLLDFILSPACRRESDDFHQRFGLKVDEAAIRCRWLGTPPADAPVLLSDFSAPVSVLAAQPFIPSGVVIVENKTTFLTLPVFLPGWLSVLGSGNSVLVCSALPWLAARPLIYWGDIDPAGFQILARLRQRWPHVESVMMDRATFNAHRPWLRPAAAMPENFTGQLTAIEAELYADVTRRGEGLEQERILQTWVDAAFDRLRATYAGTLTPVR